MTEDLKELIDMHATKRVQLRIALGDLRRESPLLIGRLEDLLSAVKFKQEELDGLDLKIINHLKKQLEEGTNARHP